MTDDSRLQTTDQHTPGPWCVVGRETALEVVEARRNWMRVCFLTSDGACEANARLIAAAPDLLAACRRLRAVINDHVSLADVDALDAAITKAEGKL